MVTSILMFPIYVLKTVFWWFGNLIRRFWEPPEYILFTLEGDYPQIPQIGGNLLLRLFRPPQLSLMELGEQIRRISEDPRLKGVVFLLRPLEMPLAKIDEIRTMFKRLQAAGKTVTTWSFVYDTPMYYLASAADNITLLPGGMLAPMGIYRQYFYLADALKMVGIKANFLQTSPYKSAGDMFLRNDMSEEVKEMSQWLADSTYDEIVSVIAEGRNIEKEAAVALIDQTPCTDLDALNVGAVDALVGEEELPQFLGSEKEPAKLLTWETAKKRLMKQRMQQPNKYIALLRIEGMIVDGHSSSPPMDIPFPVPIVYEERAGDISVVNTIRQIMRDEQALGAVLYVNSRGGSPSASESMRRALSHFAEKKPLVVVMGPVAASGGYWVSTPGKAILAQPNTLTGSIGAILGKFSDQGLLSKLSINMQSIKRGQNADIYSPEAPFSEAEVKQLRQYLDRAYDMFLERVSESRGMDRDAVDAIGGGRVWTGRQALKNGLVDELGGLDLGIQKVQEMIGLAGRPRIQIYEMKKGYIPPTGKAISAIGYGFNNLKQIYGKVTCICPWVDF